MRYVDFRDFILRELQGSRMGLTWRELKERLDLPYDRPCPEWVSRLEQEIGLIRGKGTGRAFVWTVSRRKKPG